MATLDEQISAAQARLDKAKTDNDASAQASAQSELDTLNRLKGQGYVHQSEANNGASSAREDGRTAGERAAREAQARVLGVTEDKLDDELKRLADERRNQQSEAQRLQGDVSNLTSQRDSLSTERDTEKTAREKAEAELKEERINNALHMALLGQGVRHTDGDSRLAEATNLTDKSNIQVDDKGNVTGAEDAAKATANKYAEWFTGGQRGDVGETPQSGGASGGSGGSGNGGGGSGDQDVIAQHLNSMQFNKPASQRG